MTVDMEIVPWLMTALAACSLGGIAWYFVSGIKIKAGWQNGASPLAKWLDSRRRTKFNQQLPEALATMSNALRAGFSISQAFDSVAELGEQPISEEFRILQQQLRIGMSFEDAIESLSARVGSDDLSLVTTAILISRRTGGNVTEIFDKISDTIRGRQKIERKVRTLTAQGRMQGVIVSAMPVVLGGIMTAIKPSMMIPFFCSIPGLVAIVVVVALITVGWLLIRKIITIEV
jgi:tight adherence protein B